MPIAFQNHQNKTKKTINNKQSITFNLYPKHEFEKYLFLPIIVIKL